jgi:hypothetical protein
MSILIVSFHLCLGLPSNFFNSILTHFMEQSALETANFFNTQEIPSKLCISKFHYCDHKSP